MRDIQDRSWWFLGRRNIMETVIGRFIDTSLKLQIADVGCGFGSNIPMLRQYGDVTGLELHDAALNHVKSRWGESVQTKSWQFPDGLAMTFNFMLLADVLEHVPDDKGAMGWIHEYLRENGYALITVPAHKFFWTEMDDLVGHQRRYTKQSLLRLIDTNKFEVVYCSYYNMLLFPVKVCFVLFSRLRRLLFPTVAKRSYIEVPPTLVNSLFKHILMMESSVVRRMMEPFGISVICLIRKKGSERLPSGR